MSIAEDIRVLEGEARLASHYKRQIQEQQEAIEAAIRLLQEVIKAAAMPGKTSKGQRRVIVEKAAKELYEIMKADPEREFNPQKVREYFKDRWSNISASNYNNRCSSVLTMLLRMKGVSEKGSYHNRIAFYTPPSSETKISGSYLA